MNLRLLHRVIPSCPTIGCRLVAFALGLSLAQASLAIVTLVEESVVTDEGLYFWYPNGEKAFHYAPSISPRGDCYTVANGYIFFGWYKGGMDKRDLMISRKKIGSGKWVTVQLPHKNTLIGPKARWGESHNTIAVGVSTKDDTIHIFFDHHNDPLKYIVSKKGTAFVPDREFNIDIFEPRRDYLAQGEPLRITYPKITENGQGDLIVNYRRGSAIGGNEMVHVYNGESWTRATQVIRGSDQSIPESRKNYAYGSPVFANGSVYYSFSVRWRRNKEKGVLNEGVYVAKCGPTMTDEWEDMQGGKHKLPIEDYSPFMVADPDSYKGKGCVGGPQLAVSEEGDVVLAFRGRGKGNEYDFLYTRLAGEPTFKETRGEPIRMGEFWGDRMYAARPSRDGTITVSSIRPGDSDWDKELEIDTGIQYGSPVTELVDGVLVLIVEDRSDQRTDAQKIHCYAFKVGEPKPEPKPRNLRVLTKRDDGTQVEVELIDVRDGELTCEAKGRRFVIPVSSLSDEDQEFLKGWLQERI